MPKKPYLNNGLPGYAGKVMRRAQRKGRGKSLDFDRDMDRFKKCVLRLSEHYEDYLVVAANRNGNMFQRSSNRNWSAGVCFGLLEEFKERERISVRRDEGAE